MMSYEPLSTENYQKVMGAYKHQMLISIHLPHFIQASVSLLINIRVGFLRELYTPFSIGGVILRRRPTRVGGALTLPY
jgi:hypothetical protein